MAQAKAGKKDVYLIHSGTDVLEVERDIALPLKRMGLKVAFDKWDNVPGTLKLSQLKPRLDNAKCCAVCVGKDGLVGHVKLVYQAAVERTLDESYRLIPIILSDVTQDELGELGDFLDRYYTVDFNRDTPENSLRLLVCGINNEPPGPPPDEPADGREEAPGANKLLRDVLLEKAKEWRQIQLSELKSDLEEKRITQKWADKQVDRIYKLYQKKVDEILSKTPLPSSLAGEIR